MKQRRRRPVEEPGYVSIRTDPDVYAQQALEGLAISIGPINERRSGHLRDELAEAFKEGEHQGVCRAVQILSIARANANNAQTVAAMEACLQLLGVEPKDLTKRR